MKPEEYKKKDIGELCREELAWIEKVHVIEELDPSWVNGYMSALETVLRNANRKVKVRTKMNAEERKNMQVVSRRLVKAWLELRHVISTLPEGEDVKRLIEGKAMLEAGLGVILLSLEEQSR